MQLITAHRLLAINRAFYRRYADDFTRTRRQAWPGWERLLPWLRGRVRLLDVGCGNGRFGRFWARAQDETALGEARTRAPADPGAVAAQYALQYHAIDASLPLLRETAATMRATPQVKTRLEWRDVFSDPPRHGHYPLIVLLGVLHHIPGRRRRAALLRALGERLTDDGLLVVTFWRFGADPRLRGRTLPWPDELAVRSRPMISCCAGAVMSWAPPAIATISTKRRSANWSPRAASGCGNPSRPMAPAAR